MERSPASHHTANTSDDPFSHLDHIVNHVEAARPGAVIKDDQQRAQVYVFTLPGVTPHFARAWNATLAGELVTKSGARLHRQRIDLIEWNRQQVETGLAHIDKAYARTLDPRRLELPAIAIEHLPGETPALPAAPDNAIITTVIDGNHRMYAAFSRGMREYPLVFLSAEMERACRLPDDFAMAEAIRMGLPL